MRRSKLVLVVVLVALVVAFFAFDLQQFFSLEYLKSRQTDLGSYYYQRPATVVAAYVVIYVVVTALSLPGAAVMTLVGGAIFGVLWGTVIVSFASTIGATLAFIVSRWVLRDWVQQRFGHHLGAINEGVRREGSFYLFTLRLVPLFPFFVINLVMCLLRSEEQR